MSHVLLKDKYRQRRAVSAQFRSWHRTTQNSCVDIRYYLQPLTIFDALNSKGQFLFRWRGSSGLPPSVPLVLRVVFGRQPVSRSFLYSTGLVPAQTSPAIQVNRLHKPGLRRYSVHVMGKVNAAVRLLGDTDNVSNRPD